MKDERYESLKWALSRPRIRISDRTFARAKYFFVQYYFDPQGSFGRENINRAKSLSQQFPEIADESAIREIYYAGVVGYPWLKTPELGKCPACQGSKKIDNKTCPNCQGIGQIAIGERGEIPGEKAKEYCLELLKNIPKCLYPEKNNWFIEELHQKVMFDNLEEAPIFVISEHDKPIASIHLDIPIYPQTRREDLYQLVDQALEKVKENEQYSARLQQPSDEDLQRYVKWLCRRLFMPQYLHDPEAMLRAFPADAKDSDGADVRRRTREVVKLLGIRLPRGRPAKAKKRRV